MQLSCHTLAAGRYDHVEWLADGPGDPRPEFARRLLAACSGSGSIVVYNSEYEAGCIRHLCEAVPDLRLPPILRRKLQPEARGAGAGT